MVRSANKSINSRVVTSLATRRDECKPWVMLKLSNAIWIFWGVIFLFSVSCQEEETKPSVETAMDYFPLQPENVWTYTRESITEDGQVSYADTERWKVTYDYFLSLYYVTPTSEDYFGYKALYLNGLEIDDIMGTFISTKYLDLPADSLILVASDGYDFLRERWIKGGLVKLKTSFGELECICTKTTYHLTNDQKDEYQYFCKNIGICLVELKNISVDQAGDKLRKFYLAPNSHRFQD